MNTIALLRENPDPSDDEIRAYRQETYAGVPDTKDSSGESGITRTI